MLNPFKEVNWNPGRNERRKFALSLMIGFPIIAAVFALIGFIRSQTLPSWTLWLGGIGFGVGLVLWLLPQIAKPFYVLWYVIGCSIGIVVGNVVLSLFFYLVITPMGLVMKLIGRDALRRKMDRTRKTYWQDAEKVVDLQRYYRQF